MLPHKHVWNSENPKHMNLFYHPSILPNDTSVAFDKDESRHIAKVLRKQIGDILHVTDGKGHFYEVELSSTHQKKCEAVVNKVEKQEPLPYRLHMAVAPTKTNDRFETFLEKATEIGITEISPILCDHSERTNVKPDRYERILVSAMKQSLKAYLPTLHPTMSFKDFMNQDLNASVKGIAHCEQGEKKKLKEIVSPGADVLLLVGPEGDFSSEEIQLAQAKGFLPITLGNTRLRTETAAIVACHSIAFLNL